MSQKKLRKVYNRARPLDGRAHISYTYNERDELYKKRAIIDSSVNSEYNFTKVLREAVDTIYPGAKKAGVTKFILQSLRTNNRQYLNTYKKGMKQVDTLARKEYGKSFVRLTSESRKTVLYRFKDTAFFALLKEHTIKGMFATPVYRAKQNIGEEKLIDYLDARYHPLETRGQNQSLGHHPR
ncbi:gluconate 2-dehydrogenase subunit 3 family protein [Oceanobacillus halotolerans]|uniref:gluconate 2-dehydrogenase subunit 3 family protein n=1 Tax=Oceanobacillus halotolerans TaxID=2663380 RepID=UPI0013D9259B|nr:gluconate 2-dehydrogenase subunit 3 family protein [Oceanobacillus halotolerans]